MFAVLFLTQVAFGAADHGLGHALICHNGDNDPSTEGWYRSKIHVGKIAEKAVAEDPVGGLAAWCIDDDGTTEARVTLSYQKTLTVPELAVVDGRRWRFTMHLRVVESLQRPNFSVCGEVANSTTRYLMRFTTDDQDNTVLTLGLRGPTMTAKIAGLGYHRFDFVFEPAKGSSGELAVFVDGDKEPILNTRANRRRTSRRGSSGARTKVALPGKAITIWWSSPRKKPPRRRRHYRSPTWLWTTSARGRI